MDLLPIAFFVFILFSFGMGVYALILSARAPETSGLETSGPETRAPELKANAELRRIAQLAAVQLLEPGLSLGAFLGLSRLTEPPFNLVRSSDWGSLGVGILGFGLVLLQLTPLAFRVWTTAETRELAGHLTRFGLWRTVLSAAVLVFILGSGEGWFADSGLQAENQSLLEQIVPWMVLLCFLASVAVFLYTLASLYSMLTRVGHALRTVNSPPLEDEVQL